MEKISVCPRRGELNSNCASRALLIVERLKNVYTDAECALEYDSGDENAAFRLLVMARLSAQCTDKRVNEVSKRLFAAYPTPLEMSLAPLETLEKLVFSCGVYKVKAMNIRDMSVIISRDYNGCVPQTREELLKLPGVGMKIANLLMGDLFGDPSIVADTHCIRIAHRLGLTSVPDNPKKCTDELSALIPKPEQSSFCHRIVLFGREFCSAASPKCQSCPLF